MSCRFLTDITFVFRCEVSSRGVDTMNVPAPHNEKQTTTIASFRIQLTDNYSLSFESVRILRQTPQISKAVNSGAVSIRPAGLQPIAADQIESGKFEALVTVAHLRTRNMAEHVGFTATRGARA